MTEKSHRQIEEMVTRPASYRGYSVHRDPVHVHDREPAVWVRRWFVGPRSRRKFGGPRLDQVAFTIFVLTETWLVGSRATWFDRFGPRPVVMAAASCAGNLAEVLN